MLDRTHFENAAADCAEQLQDWPILDVFRERDKIGTYAIVSSNGTLYGVTQDDNGPRHLNVGSLLCDHLAELADRLPFSKGNHQKRYQLASLSMIATPPR